MMFSWGDACTSGVEKGFLWRPQKASLLPAYFKKGVSSLLGGSAEALAYVGLIFIALALAVMMLMVRLGRGASLSMNWLVMGQVPLFDSEIRGVDMLKKIVP